MNKSPSDEAVHQLASDGTNNHHTSHNHHSLSSSSQLDISMKNFLDFLATAYRLNDALENYPLETFKKSNTIDWNQLSTCIFLSTIFSNEGSDRHCQKKSQEHDHSSHYEESDVNLSSKQNGITDKSHDDIQSLDKSSEKVEDDCKPIPKQNLKRSEKHKRGRSASLTNNGNGRAEKSKLDKRRSSFAKKDSSDSKSRSRGDVSIVERLVKRKLSEVLQEGILDSVLPYVIPKQSGTLSPKKPLTVEKKNNHDKLPGSSVNQNKDNISVYHSKKPNFMITENSKDTTNDIEVEIHVCDEVKNTKKDFRCSQKLLVSKMGYFAEVTTGQNLEDMDISVHCDITIFEWLMRWVKKDASRPELAPQLDAANVIPVLVSAAFLQMDPLLNDCLQFCQEHMNEILRQATNLSCLNDSIITRLANQFTNVEIEEIRDKRDKLQSRLFCKLITFLGEPEPDQRRGHFASLAYMFQCAYCHKLLPQTLSLSVACRSSSNRINSMGQIQGVHVRNPDWSVTEWIRQVRAELGCWRSVYWRLWGHTHWLQCYVCHLYYPVSQTDWCSYHPDSPQFFIMEQHRTMSFPIGRYPCCGERAYRFEVLQNTNGCTYRSHVPIVDSNISFAIQKIFQTHRHLIAIEPPRTVFQERLTRLVRSNRDGSNIEDNKDCVPNTSLWWHGLELAPSCYKTALISRIWEKPKESKSKAHWVESCPRVSNQQVYSEVSGSSENATSSPEDTERDSSPSLGEDNSEDSLLCTSPVQNTNKKNCSMFVYCPNQPNQWLARYSTRYNQDSLRDYEEWSLGTVVGLLSRRHGDLRGSLRGKWGPHITPLGGTYVRLEAQWREGHMHLYQGSRVPVITNSRGRPIISTRARPRSNLR
ncbi:SANT and BTB domain regulator of class switch recombination-like [Macrosteles quadrilineatus]|uniref:SANT and BTB domain regulator of class switch recombination-like n=1 Tax=Macrosteles quadrilineatus TaxID=74068 RepID=UPI0023E0DE6C|nr:SANT and BTB domain regulator of class switch recombination-like [Macrosteles quadrilineatus]